MAGLSRGERVAGRASGGIPCRRGRRPKPSRERAGATGVSPVPGAMRSGLRPAAAFAILLLAIVVLQARPVHAQATVPPADWPRVKCERYAAAWREVLARYGGVGHGESGLGGDFVARQEAFIASGCTARHDVCPRSPRELEVANILSLRAMNAGMTGSFLPFACPD